MRAVVYILLATFPLLGPSASEAQETSAQSQQVESTELKKHALFLLASRGTPESARFLRDFYARTKDPELQKTVVFHIAQSGTDEDIEWLRRTVQDQDAEEEIRKAALFWLAQNDRTTLAQLEEMYGNMESRELKEQVLFAYSQKQEPEAVDRLMAIARGDPDRKLRKTALFWLAQSRDGRVTQLLVDIINQ
jgi:HEAT repeat protein